MKLKAWMARNFLHLNEKKTEVIVFGPDIIGGSSLMDVGPPAPYRKPAVTNPGLDAQSSAAVKSRSFQIKRILVKDVSIAAPTLSACPLHSLI